MISAQKNIAVYSEECSTICKENCEATSVCALCKPCLTPTLKIALLKAHKENLHKGDFRRLYPPTMNQHEDIETKLTHLNYRNRIQHLWYQGKCNMDVTWCV